MIIHDHVQTGNVVFGCLGGSFCEILAYSCGAVYVWERADMVVTLSGSRRVQAEFTPSKQQTLAVRTRSSLEKPNSLLENILLGDKQLSAQTGPLDSSCVWAEAYYLRRIKTMWKRAKGVRFYSICLCFATANKSSIYTFCFLAYAMKYISFLLSALWYLEYRYTFQNHSSQKQTR